MKILISNLLIIFSLSLFAKSLDDVNFPDQVKVEGKELLLNGIGIRKATFLKIKVYYGALYLEQVAKDPALFLKNSTSKQIIMHFVRDVEAKKLRDAFSEGMEAANSDHAKYKTHMDKFNSHISDVVKGDEIIITFLTDGVLVNNKGKLAEKIAGNEFSSALLSIWFINARDENLRDGLLSLK